MTITDTYDYTEIDRQYDREIARLERQRRVRGEDSDFPVFAVSMDQVDALIAEGREEYGHPGTWPSPLDETEDEEYPETHCSLGLHEKAVTPQEPNGECRFCRNIRRRRNAAEKRGDPLCWTATHPEPDEGFICECGEAPPSDDFIDWVLVENAVAGRELDRRLTTAEQASCILTVMKRNDQRMGPYEARVWLRDHTDVKLSENQVWHLMYRWEGEKLSALGAFNRDVQEAAGQEESRPAA